MLYNQRLSPTASSMRSWAIFSGLVIQVGYFINVGLVN